MADFKASVAVAVICGLVVVVGIVLLMMTRLRAELVKARWAVDHDSLTGLGSRVAARRWYEKAACEGVPPTMVLLDLDHLKVVNDTYGHPAGDTLICAVADRLAAARGASAIAARLGGDEFLLLLPPAEAGDVEAKVDGILSMLALPVLIEDSLGGIAHVEPSASAGIAVGEPGVSWGHQLRRADIALYSAKQRRHGAATYRTQMTRRAVSSSSDQIIAVGEATSVR